jgi:hypothetical protein
MATRAKAAPKATKTRRAPAHVLYLYGISRTPKRRTPAIAAEGVDGSAPAEAVRCQDLLCWISRVSRAEFADRILEHMEYLEWLTAAGLRHQRVVAEIAGKVTILPARFATVFLSEASLLKHTEQRRSSIEAALARVADADEWGIKVFAVATPKAPRAPASGAEYLKHKAKTLQPRSRAQLDRDVGELVSALKSMGVADCPGGKASAGQPGLVWHGSFLIRRRDRKKLETVLRKYAKQWQNTRRIDCSGPWPPYSFVGENV